MDADDTAPSDEDSGSSPGSSNKKRKSLSTSINQVNPKDSAPSGQPSADGSSNSQINKHWREKICEWAYQGKLDALDMWRIGANLKTQSDLFGWFVRFSCGSF